MCSRRFQHALQNGRVLCGDAAPGEVVQHVAPGGLAQSLAAGRIIEQTFDGGRPGAQIGVGDDNAGATVIEEPGDISLVAATTAQPAAALSMIFKGDR